MIQRSRITRAVQRERAVLQRHNAGCNHPQPLIGRAGYAFQRLAIDRKAVDMPAHRIICGVCVCHVVEIQIAAQHVQILRAALQQQRIFAGLQIQPVDAARLHGCIRSLRAVLNLIGGGDVIGVIALQHILIHLRAGKLHAHVVAGIDRVQKMIAAHQQLIAVHHQIIRALRPEGIQGAHLRAGDAQNRGCIIRGGKADQIAVVRRKIADFTGAGQHRRLPVLRNIYERVARRAGQYEIQISVPDGGVIAVLRDGFRARADAQHTRRQNQYRNQRDDRFSLHNNSLSVVGRKYPASTLYHICRISSSAQLFPKY